MASSHDWQGYGNPLPGPGGGEIPLNNFDDFQQYAHPQSSQPYEGADSGNHFFGSTSFPNYPPIQSGGYFGANSFSGNNLPDQQSHFSGTHGYENVDSGGGGVHGHGAPSHQSYRGPGFNTHPGYGTLPQSEFNTGYEAEQQTQAQQQAQAHDHAPSAFGTQAWQAQSQQLLAQQVPTQQTPSQQVPPQQATANFAQRTIGYETHSPSPMYQQRQQIGPYPGAPIGQRGISFGSSGANGYYGAQSPQVPTPQYGDQGRDSAGVGGYQTSINPPPARPAEPVALNSLEVSQSGQFQPLKEQNKDDGAAWVLPEGSPNLFAKNPPKTKIGNFAAVIAGIAKKRPTKQDGTKHLPPGNPLLPRRSCRLPSEIQAERTWLEGLLENATTSTSRNAIQQRLTRLDNEQVIIADLEGSKPIPRVSKASRVKVPKHKSPAMDSTRKSRSSESEDDDDISLNGVARQIMSNPRPQVALEAVKYDVIKVLWRDPKLPEPSTQAVGDNIHAFGNYVTDLWTKSKDLKSDVEKAQNEKDEAKLQSLRAALDSTYTSIQVAIEAAIKFGDNYTLTQLGTHKKLFGSFCILLRNRFAAKDYNGPMPKAILKLMSLAVTVNTAFLTTKAKLDPVRQKYNSNLDEEARDYMDLIFDNAKKRSALEAETSREDAKKGDDVKKAIPGGPKKTSTTSTRDVQPTPKLLPPKKNVPLKANAEIKKMQPINYSGLGSARKISNVAKANSSSTSSKRPSDEDVDLRAPKKAAVENGTGVPSAPKTTSTAPATAQAPSAPSAQARSRPTGSMLPGRSRVSVMQPKKPAPQAASAPPAPQQTSNSLIGDLLAQIAAPKEEAKAPKEPERPPETPEETARRLRKESRRHLRVSWKPNDELTSIRTFEHDTTEDEGRDDSMLRDARDNRSEGRMFKQGMQPPEDDNDGEILREGKMLKGAKWNFGPTPRLVKCIPGDREKVVYESRGGSRPVESEQKKVMDEYESRELMEVYTSKSEIPETPASPTGRVREVTQQPKLHILQSNPGRWQESIPPTAKPSYTEIHRRWSDSINFGPTVMLGNALRRLKAPGNPSHNNSLPTLPNLLPFTSPNASTHFPNSFPTTSPKMSDSRSEADNSAEVLRLLTSNQVKNWVDPAPYNPANPQTHRRYDYADPKVQRDADALEDVFANYSGKPFPAVEPPEHLRSNPERLAEWYRGHNHDLATQAQAQQPPQPQQPLLLSDIERIMQQAKEIQVRQAAEAAAKLAQEEAQKTAQNLNLADILALLQGTGQQTAPTQPVPAQSLPPTPNLYQQGWSQQPAQPLQQPGHGYNGYGYNQTQPPPPQAYGGQAPNVLSYGGQVPPQAWNNTGPEPYGGQTQPPQAYGGLSQPPHPYGNQPQPPHSHHPQPYGAHPQQQQQQQTAQGQHSNGGRGGHKDSHRGNKEHKGINHALIGTKACSFWAAGKCLKGADCTFRHDPNDLKNPNDGPK